MGLRIEFQKGGFDRCNHLRRGIGPDDNGHCRNGIADMDESEPFFLILVGNDIFDRTGIELAFENGVDDGVMMPEKSILLEVFERNVGLHKRIEWNDMSCR